MRLALLLSLMVTGSVSSALDFLSFSGISRDQALCFGREYSEDFLRANPLHSLKQIKLKFYREPYANDSGISLSVQALVKDRTSEDFGAEVYSNVSSVLKGLKCEVGSSSLSCEMECGGGKVEMNWNVSTQQNTVTFQSQETIMHSDCGKDLDLLLSRTRDGSASVLRLYPLPQEFCQL